MHTLTEAQWRDVLAEPGLITDKMAEIFAIIHARPDYRETAGKIARAMGYDHKKPDVTTNGIVGKFGKKLRAKYRIKPRFYYDNGKPEHWDIVFDGWKENGVFFWAMRPELIKAYEDSDIQSFPNHGNKKFRKKDRKFFEGKRYDVKLTKYERNPAARKKCIDHYGMSCVVCGLYFAQTYGEIGANFIHVHHLNPVAQKKSAYEVDPVKDLRPVCPNCHAMLHSPSRNEPPLTIEELKGIVVQQLKGASGD